MSTFIAELTIPSPYRMDNFTHSTRFWSAIERFNPALFEHCHEVTPDGHILAQVTITADHADQVPELVADDFPDYAHHITTITDRHGNPEDFTPWPAPATNITVVVSAA